LPQIVVLVCSKPQILAQSKKKGLNDFIEEKTGRKKDEVVKSEYRRNMDKKYGRGGKYAPKPHFTTVDSSGE